MSSFRPQMPQLHMVWPSSKLHHPPEVSLAPGYLIRTYHPGDEEPFLHLMSLMDFDAFDDAKLAENMNKVIPEGWFFATHCRDRIVGTTLCLDNYSGRSPFTGDLGWVACHPDHRGKGLGLALCARAVQRFLESRYGTIQLHTEHYRLAAIKTYLRVGFVPSIGSSELGTLWQEVCSRLDWPFQPRAWSETCL